jgi:hypothetical protein
MAEILLSSVDGRAIGKHVEDLRVDDDDVD